MREFLRRVLPEPVANFLRLCICSINDIAMRLKLWLRGHQRSSGTALLKPAQLDRLLIQELAACAEGGVGVVDERLMWFVDRLEALARPVGRGKRILVWPFERTGATGHLAMEPFYVKSVYGDDYDQIIVVTRQRHSAHNSNTEIFDCVFAGMTVVCTDDPVLLALSGHELGVVERGPFAFLLHSYEIGRAHV